MAGAYRKRQAGQAGEGLHIERILVNGILRPSVEYPALSGIHYVNIGDIAINNNKPVRVSVTMSGCTGEGTSYLDVTAIWTCEDILMKLGLTVNDLKPVKR